MMKNTNEMELVFDSRPVNEGFARVSVAAFMTQLNPTLEEVSDVKTAVSEAVTNALKFVCSYPLHLFTHTEISYVVMTKSYIFDDACASTMLRTLAADAEIYLIGIFITIQTHHMPLFFV